MSSGRFIKGQIPWNKGKELSEEHRKGISLSNKGRIPWAASQKGKGTMKANPGSFKKGNVPACPFKKGHKFWLGKKRPNVSGSNNKNWKGDKVGYTALHDWVRRNLGRPMVCSECGTTTSKRYEWANISKRYFRDITDWKRLCSKCHLALDHESRPKGSIVVTSKLTEDQVKKIRNEYIPKRHISSMPKLAKKYGVHLVTISGIIHRKTWKHI